MCFFFFKLHSRQTFMEQNFGLQSNIFIGRVLFFVKSPNFYFPFFRKGIGWFVFISWEKWVSAGQNGRKIWGGNNSFPTRVRKTFLGNLLETKSSVVNRAMFVYPKLTRAEVERVINTQHRGKPPPPIRKEQKKRRKKSRNSLRVFVWM